jgi:hypothetical protein
MKIKIFILTLFISYAGGVFADTKLDAFLQFINKENNEKAYGLTCKIDTSSAKILCTTSATTPNYVDSSTGIPCTPNSNPDRNPGRNPDPTKYRCGQLGNYFFHNFSYVGEGYCYGPLDNKMTCHIQG